MGAFGCLFGGIILIFFLVLSLGLFLLQKILGLFGIRLPFEKFFHVHMGQPYGYGNGPQANNPSSSSDQATASVSQKKQVYADDEGEYVEFEEIKD